MEKDNKKLRAQEKRVEERRQTEKRKREQEVREADVAKTQAKPTAAPTTATSSAAASTSPMLRTRPSRPAPIPQGQLENTVEGKTPNTPTRPALSPRLRLGKDNFKIAEPKKPDAYYEKRIQQEMIQRSYINFHPTTGYHQATQEMREFYDGFETFDDKFNPNKPIKDDETKQTTLQQLLSISYSYAPDFCNEMKLQKMDYLRQQGFVEEQVQQREAALQHEDILELYIVLSEKTLQQWLLLGTIPGCYLENGTADRHTWYNFHTGLETLSTTSSTSTSTTIHQTSLNRDDMIQHLRQLHYLVIVHTTRRLVRKLKDDLKNFQN
eukprot:2660656-Amphidinium_carterae.2